MYRLDDLIRLLASDAADELSIRIESPPIIIFEGVSHSIEGPAITPEDAERLVREITDTRQRRELKEKNIIQFIYRFQQATDFLVEVRLEGGTPFIKIV